MADTTDEGNQSSLEDIAGKLAWDLKSQTVRLKGLDLRRAVSFKTNVKVRDYELWWEIANLVSGSYASDTKSIKRRNGGHTKLYGKAVGDVNIRAEKTEEVIKNVTYDPIVMIHDKIYFKQVYVFKSTTNSTVKDVADRLLKADFRLASEKDRKKYQKN